MYRFVMEGHLVHYQSKFKNISQALESKERDALTVIGIFFYVMIEIIPTAVTQQCDQLPYFF